MSTIRISKETQNVVRELSEHYGVSMQDVVEKAVKELRRQQFFAELDESYAALQKDSEAWDDYQNELSEWDVTLNDGLEDL